MKLNMKLISLACTMLVVPNLNYAFFCPSNFSQIELGMTIDQITQICGKPTTQKESTKTNDNVPQEWTYYVPQSVALSNSSTGNGTLKTSVAFDSSGKVINITVNGIGVGQSTICGNTISLGDSRDSVKSSCGEPTFNSMQGNTLTSSNQEAPPIKVMDFTYSSTPPVTLEFENGILKSTK